MRKPENFNAGATVKKPNPLEAAINGNFSTEKESPIVSPTPTSEKVVTSPEPINIQQEQLEEKEKKEKFLVSMAKGERSNFKAFCAMKNISMNHFVMCAMDYFKEDLESGKVTISQHSYKRQ